MPEHLFPNDLDVDFGELAHVIPASPDGPRGVPLDEVSLEDRAHHSNLTLLCANCHTTIDKALAAYPDEMLHEWKQKRIEEIRIAVATPTFQTRAEARAHLQAELDANRAIHTNFGPVGDPYRDGNPALWRRHARGTIVPNNRKIRQVLEANRHLLTRDEQETLAVYQLHVEQFEDRHILDDFTTGTERFPEAIERILLEEKETNQVGIGLEDGEMFDAEDVDASIEKGAGTGFFVVVPTQITHVAYERAEERGICVTGFVELLDALKHDENIAQHIDSQEQYERRRLTHNKDVKSLKRKGRHAYEIRRDKLRSLTIITTNDYEFTADRLYTLLESYQTIEPDLIVVTNPSCCGFSTDSQRAAAQAGIPLVRFGDFLDDLGAKWT